MSTAEARSPRDRDPVLLGRDDLDRKAEVIAV
jgi:hypothetical protein